MSGALNTLQPCEVCCCGRPAYTSSANSTTIYSLPFAATSLLAVNDSMTLIKLVAWDRLQVGNGLCEDLSSTLSCSDGGSKNKQAEASHCPTDTASVPLLHLAPASQWVTWCFCFWWVAGRIRNYELCLSSKSSTQLITLYLFLCLYQVDFQDLKG